MALDPGTRLGPYEILALIGAGGMGQVYRAHDARLNRDVALKVLPEAFVLDPERLARFTREAQVLASLNHPHIAAIYGIEESDGLQALVLELVDGPTLADRLASGRMPIDDAFATARQIADALEAAHERGIVHRDLKPANVAFTADGHVKVLDFGLAKAIEPATSTVAGLTQSPTLTFAATQAGVVLGTAAYMSPEQAKGRAADKRSDVWAFGCVLYEMLTGRRAFDGEDATEIIAAVVRAEPDWSALPNDVPEHVRLLLRRCLEKDRGKRVSDVSTARFLITEPVAAAAPAVPVHGPAVSSQSPLWRRAVPFLVTGVLAAAATAAVGRVIRPAPAPQPIARLALPLGDNLRFTNVNRQLVAISPDGTRIAFVANQHLYVRDLASSEVRALAGDSQPSAQSAGVASPAFSPDGRFVAYFSIRDRLIKRVAVVGGSPITVCAFDSPFGLSWDESGIVFAEPNKGILRVPGDGGQPQVIVGLTDDEVADTPHILPGGRSVLFTIAKGIGADRWEHARVVVQSLASGERKTVLEQGSAARYVKTGHLVYAIGGILFAIPFDLDRLQTSGGAVAAVEGLRRPTAGAGVQGNPLLSGTAQYSVSETGTLIYLPGPVAPLERSNDVAWVDRAGKVERLQLPPAGYSHVRVSPDGRRMVVDREEGKETNVYVYAFGTGGALRRLTFGGSNRDAIWTADGKRVVFQSDREGDRGIYWQPADGSGVAERLTKAEEGTHHVPETWSPAGDVLLYSVAKGPTFTLWSLTARDKRSAPFANVSSTAPIESSFSPDGRWVAYSASATVFVQPFPPSGALYQVPQSSGPHHPFWSRDGKELFYEAGIGLLHAVPVTTTPEFTFGAPLPLAAGGYGSTNPAFTRNRDVDVEGKRFISPVSLDTAAAGIALTGDIQVVLNWTEELKQRAPRAK